MESIELRTVDLSDSRTVSPKLKLTEPPLESTGHGVKAPVAEVAQPSPVSELTRQKYGAPPLTACQTYEALVDSRGPTLSKLPCVKPLSLPLRSSHCCDAPAKGDQLKRTV